MGSDPVTEILVTRKSLINLFRLCALSDNSAYPGRTVETDTTRVIIGCRSVRTVLVIRWHNLDIIALRLLSFQTVVAHYDDVTMGTMASQITSLKVVYWTVYSGANQRKHQSFASLAFVRGIQWWPMNSPHKGPVTRKMLPFDDAIMSRWSWSWTTKRRPALLAHPDGSVDCTLVAMK